MKKFTEKQIGVFMSAINNGILEYMNDNYMIDNLEIVSDELSKVDESRYILSDISNEQIANEYSSRGETYHLIQTLIDSEDVKEKSLTVKLLFDRYKQYIPKQAVTRKTMIDLLGLRDFATKEDILKELNEIL